MATCATCGHCRHALVGAASLLHCYVYAEFAATHALYASLITVAVLFTDHGLPVCPWSAGVQCIQLLLSVRANQAESA